MDLRTFCDIMEVLIEKKQVITWEKVNRYYKILKLYD